MYTFFYKYLKSITVVTIMFMITAFAFKHLLWRYSVQSINQPITYLYSASYRTWTEVLHSVKCNTKRYK